MKADTIRDQPSGAMDEGVDNRAGIGGGVREGGTTVLDGGTPQAEQLDWVRPGRDGPTHERASAADRRVDILGCPIDALDMGETVARCLALIEAGTGARQVSVNAAKLTQFDRDPQMSAFIRGSDVISADGQSIVWASRLLGRGLPGRVPGIDLMRELLAAAETRGLTVYVLGARETVLVNAVKRIRAAHPRLQLAGTHHGYFGPEEESGVAASIRDAAPDLLFVAMSSPRKEQWLGRNAERLGVPFAMGVGGAVDVWAGERSRAPAWLQRLGLEWVHRLIQEPRRMGRRYSVENLRFIWLLLKELARGPSKAVIRAR